MSSADRQPGLVPQEALQRCSWNRRDSHILRLERYTA
jgi:hypothetical protein